MENVLLGNLALSSRAQIGRFWFKNRSLSPIPLFLLLLIMPANIYWTGLSYAVILSVLFLAESLRVWAVGYAGSSTRTRGDRVNDFVHAGPYRHVRNPLYIANILLYAVTGLLFGNVLLAMIILIYSVVQYSLIVAYEEEILISTFSSQYEEFFRRVPRWIPSLNPKIQSTSHTFNLTQALKSEKSTFYSILLMAILFFLKRSFL